MDDVSGVFICFNSDVLLEEVIPLALQEFLASYAVKVDEDGARRLQRILDQNQKSASDLTSSFTSARRALLLLKAELSDASGLKDIFASLSSGFSNLSLPKLSGDALSSLGGSAGPPRRKR